MSLSLKLGHFKRYRDVARLVFKYGRLKAFRNDGDGKDGNDTVSAAMAAELAEDLERMGPTFIKIGQLLSTRSDLLSPTGTEALSRLQDHVTPFAFAEAEQIVTTELGVRLSRAFAEFDPQPVAAASLGQVHRARMRDGREVAVKVQRPDARPRAGDDLAALHEIATLLEKRSESARRYRLTQLVDEFRRTIMQELDYRQEARNLDTLADNLRDYDRIVVPRPVHDFTATRVLTMDYVVGEKITKLGPLARMDLPGDELADQLFRAYLRQILVDGFLHADPHPGNVFLTPDQRVALLDVGMVVRIEREMQEKLIVLLFAISEGRGEDAASALIDLGEARPDLDRIALKRDIAEIVARHQQARMEEIEIGRVLTTAASSAARCGLLLPSELNMVGQTLLKLDQVGRILAPEFEPNAWIRRHVLRAARRRMLRSASMGKLFKSAADLRDFVGGLPGRVNHVLDALADNQLEVRVRAIDETRLMAGIQKIANRITMGLVLAALIVGAALLMRVETSFRILGYPGLAILLFLAAAVGGVALVIQIVLKDDPTPPPGDNRS